MKKNKKVVVTALSYIASNGTLKNLKTILKLTKIDVNKQDNEGNTPLHFASQAGQVEAINYMLSICPNVEIDARNSLGFTPLMKAALQGRTKCAKLLLFAGASPSLRDSGRGLKAEQWARFCGRYVCAEVIEKFTKQKFSDKTSSGIKSRLRKAFRTISHPGPEVNGKPYSVVSQLTTVALCASTPVLQSSVSSNIKSLMRPLAVPKVEV
ncbi:ankyrin repeat-containing protein, putative [Pediculus humanus corporis]|uniref:Ankyrin repeat-containing protein, putative n=1 Tax=Pediculus humanus subsp. corporis TaxID=121224 RepID=E0W024_PEDHC|nr:ankyrin repeat-containing protein, putative [Pediculus humanus corporis]EEB18980.1 ankyrin repeat-containing protein, putative [Pediculus humanus corporis]